MPYEPLVRDAQMADLPSIITMAMVLGQEHVAYDRTRFLAIDRATLSDAYQGWMLRTHQPGDMRCLVAQRSADDPALCGYAIAEHYIAQPEFWTGACVYIHDIYCTPETQGMGLGKRFVSTIEAWAKTRGVSQMRCLIAEANHPSQAFFGGRGFRVSAREHSYDIAP